MPQELMLEPESLSDIMEQADRASYFMSEVRGAILAPERRKVPPTFNATQLAALCDELGSSLETKSLRVLCSGFGVGLSWASCWLEIGPLRPARVFAYQTPTLAP